MLRERDQRVGHTPEVCVKTGERTTSAVRVRAVAMWRTDALTSVVGVTVTGLVARLLRHATTPVALAVSDDAWRRWRRRLARAVVVVSCGLGIVVAGALRTDLGLVSFGAVVVILGSWMRRRSWLVCWVGLTYRQSMGEVLVTRIHPAFAHEARRIYIDSVRRHPSPR